MRKFVFVIVASAALGTFASALAAASPAKEKPRPSSAPAKTVVCHATTSTKHPYVRIVVSGKTLKGHLAHPRDVVNPAGGTCPTSALTPKKGGKKLSATMIGSAEIPGPGDPDGRGTAAFRLNHGQGMVCFSLQVSNITLPASASHIHIGGPTVAGDIVVGLTPPDATGRSSGCVAVDRALVKAILENPAGYYVNVHTTDFPAGAMRGQLS
jgi:hypothetical protein